MTRNMFLFNYAWQQILNAALLTKSIKDMLTKKINILSCTYVKSGTAHRNIVLNWDFVFVFWMKTQDFNIW